MSWLSSPLTATAVVCAGLTAISFPLRELTSGNHRAPLTGAAVVSNDEEHVHEMPGVLRVRLLSDASSLRVTTTDGDVLWEAENLAAGEEETEVDLRLIDDALELRVEADFGDHQADTALFLTVLPDGIEEQTRYAIGSVGMDEILHYEWHLH